MDPQSTTRTNTIPWRVVILFFTLGLLCRLVVFGGQHDEGDEVIYRVLVDQLANGHGYTLHGTDLIGDGYPADQYDKPLFFHPPGGVVLFWLLSRIFGDAGFPLAQILGYVLFFFGMIGLSRSIHPVRPLETALVAALSAFSPIMSHATSRFWLDGPLLGVSTVAAAFFLRGVGRREARWAIVAGLLLGYATWIKLTAILIVPGLLMLAWHMTEATFRRTTVRLSLWFVALAVLIQIPWELWQWAEVGSPFPAWAGKPSAWLIENNRYVYFLTVVRSPWVYLFLLPRIQWTLVPSLAALFFLPLEPSARRSGFALVGWAVVILGFHIALGFLGYSKVIRYVILVTPALILLAALVGAESIRRITDPGRSKRERIAALAFGLLLSAGYLLEIAQTVLTTWILPPYDVILPLL